MGRFVLALQGGELRGVTMFGWLRKRPASQIGRDAARTLISEIDAHFDDRVNPAGDRVVDVFSECLTRVFDEADLDPRDLTRVQWDIFEENLTDFAGQMRAEITCKQDEVGDGESRELLDNYVTQRMTEIVDGIREQAYDLLEVTIAEIERREARQ